MSARPGFPKVKPYSSSPLALGNTLKNHGLKTDSFTVGDDGSIYIFDSCNHKLKTFKDGKYVSSLDFCGVNSGGEVQLASMAYAGGSVYGIDSVTGKIYRINGDRIEEFCGPLPGFDKIMPLPCDFLCVCSESSKKIFDTAACLRYDSETSAESQNFLYRDKSGNTITANAEYGYPDGPLLLELKNSDGLTVKTISFDTFSDSINADGSEIRVSGPGLIGFDASGCAYFDIYANRYSVAGDDTTIRSWSFFLARLDPQSGAFKIIKVPVDGEYAYLPRPTASGGMYDTITPDGCLYRAYITNAVGVRIVKFDFD